MKRENKGRNIRRGERASNVVKLQIHTCISAHAGEGTVRDFKDFRRVKLPREKRGEDE